MYETARWFLIVKWVLNTKENGLEFEIDSLQCFSEWCFLVFQGEELSKELLE